MSSRRKSSVEEKNIEEKFFNFQFVRLASNRTSTKTLTTPNKANGNIRKKTSISPQSNDSSYSPTTMDEKNNNLVTKSKSLKTSEEKKERRNSIDFDEHQENLNEKKQPIGNDVHFELNRF